MSNKVTKGLALAASAIVGGIAGFGIGRRRKSAAAPVTTPATAPEQPAQQEQKPLTVVS